MVFPYCTVLLYTYFVCCFCMLADGYPPYLLRCSSFPTEERTGYHPDLFPEAEGNHHSR